MTNPLNFVLRRIVPVRRAPKTRRPATVASVVEHLEQRRLLAFDPNAQAQELLENVNRMRMYPQAELPAMSEGGYQLRVPQGNYTMTAFRGTLTGVQQATGIRVVDADVKVDLGNGVSLPAILPSAPTGVVASAGNAQAVVRWVAPASDGGAAITNYIVQFSRDVGASWTTFVRSGSTVTSTTVTGLVNGSKYMFRVAAVNAVGTGGFSGASGSITPTAPITSPSAPTIDVATPGNGRVALSWRPPLSNGGSGITGYRVQHSTDGGQSWATGTVVPSTRTRTAVSGLRNEVKYVFRVAAINAVGTGAFSLSTTPVTPAAGIVTPIDLAPFANQRLQSVGFGLVSRLPEGNVTLGGVQFAIPVGGKNIWTGYAASGANPRILDVAVNATGITQVHTLINTLWGERDAGARASITFYGSAGTVYTIELNGDEHIRDYLWNTWTNRINGTSTVNVFTAGSGQGIAAGNQVRLDMQAFNLPAEFASQTLTKIRIADWGGTKYQRLIVSGITVR